MYVTGRMYRWNYSSCVTYGVTHACFIHVCPAARRPQHWSKSCHTFTRHDPLARQPPARAPFLVHLQCTYYSVNEMWLAWIRHTKYKWVMQLARWPAYELRFVSHWLMIAFITCISNLVPLLEGLCSSNPCRFDFSVFWVFARIEPTTSGLTVPRSDQLS